MCLTNLNESWLLKMFAKLRKKRKNKHILTLIISFFHLKLCKRLRHPKRIIPNNVLSPGVNIMYIQEQIRQKGLTCMNNTG
ncbi:MAG: hypothetical protein EA394_08960 [Bacteroidia bacterium]|nr:MAG: hypothetical protein EA394_08960 [Bacteroidia bacterium]